VRLTDEPVKLTGVTTEPVVLVAVIARLAFATPDAVGMNTTLMVQLPFGGVGAVPHVPGVADSENGPVKTRFVIGSSVVEESAVTVTDCATLVAPIATSP
jgi:hypothetical protein